MLYGTNPKTNVIIDHIAMLSMIQSHRILLSVGKNMSQLLCF